MGNGTMPQVTRQAEVSPQCVLSAGLLEEAHSSGMVTQGWGRGEEVTQDTPVKAQGSGSYTGD